MCSQDKCSCVHTQPHAGFPESKYHDMAEALARAGHRVVVVEQVGSFIAVFVHPMRLMCLMRPMAHPIHVCSVLKSHCCLFIAHAQSHASPVSSPCDPLCHLHATPMQSSMRPPTRLPCIPTCGPLRNATPQQPTHACRLRRRMLLPSATSSAKKRGSRPQAW